MLLLIANFGLSNSKIPLRASNDNPTRAAVADSPTEIRCRSFSPFAKRETCGYGSSMGMWLYLFARIEKKNYENHATA